MPFLKLQELQKHDSYPPLIHKPLHLQIYAPGQPGNEAMQISLLALMQMILNAAYSHMSQPTCKELSTSAQGWHFQPCT